MDASFELLEQSKNMCVSVCMCVCALAHLDLHVSVFILYSQAAMLDYASGVHSI